MVDNVGRVGTCPMHGTGDITPSPPSKERKVSFKDEKNKSGLTSREHVPTKGSLQRKHGTAADNVRKQLQKHEKLIRVDSEKGRHPHRNGSFTSHSGQRTNQSHLKQSIIVSHTSNHKHSHGVRDKPVSSASDLYCKSSTQNSDGLLAIEEKEDLRRSSAPSRMGYISTEKESREGTIILTNREFYGRKHRVSAEIHMPRRSISLEEDNYSKDRWKDSRETLYIRQRSPSTTIKALPAHLDEKGQRRYSCDGRKYSSPILSKKLVSQSSVDSPSDLSIKKTVDGSIIKLSPGKRTRHKMNPSMRFASVEDGLSPTGEFEKIPSDRFAGGSGGTIKISTANFKDSNQSISSFMSGGGHMGVGGSGSYSAGASTEAVVPLFNLQENIAMQGGHASTTEESASSVSSSRRIKLSSAAKRSYLEQRAAQKYSDEVSFEGLPSFLANPITSEDQMKQEHLLPTQSKASFRKLTQFMNPVI